MPNPGAFPYDINNVLGGAARCLIAPITAPVPTKPSDVFWYQAPYMPIGSTITNGAVAAAATTITLGPAGYANTTAHLPASGTLYPPPNLNAGLPITYTGKTATTITGVPAAGAGSVTTPLPDGTWLRTATAWRDFGATREAFQYGRQLETGGYQIQQVTSDILEEVTQTIRTMRASLAEIEPANLKLLEEGVQGSVAASAGVTGAWDSVAFGTIRELTQWRVAFAARRAKASGIVTETDGVTQRGRFVVGFGYRAQLIAETTDVPLGKGELAAATATFRFFPEPSGFADGQEYGAWFLERAGALT